MNEDICMRMQVLKIDMLPFIYAYAKYQFTL